jgi:hypothetical protein
VKQAPLPADVCVEVKEAAERARSTLQIGRVRKPKRIAEAIYHGIDEFRGRKRTKKEERNSFAVDCGSLWGQALCEATGWMWKRLQSEQSEGFIAVCSPNGSYAVMPLKFIYDLVTNRKSANNSLLLFNMIAAGKLPAPVKGSDVTILG